MIVSTETRHTLLLDLVEFLRLLDWLLLVGVFLSVNEPVLTTPAITMKKRVQRLLPRFAFFLPAFLLLRGIVTYHALIFS